MIFKAQLLLAFVLLSPSAFASMYEEAVRNFVVTGRNSEGDDSLTLRVGDLRQEVTVTVNTSRTLARVTALGKYPEIEEESELIDLEPLTGTGIVDELSGETVGQIVLDRRYLNIAINLNDQLPLRQGTWGEVDIGELLLAVGQGVSQRIEKTPQINFVAIEIYGIDQSPIRKVLDQKIQRQFSGFQPDGESRGPRLLESVIYGPLLACAVSFACTSAARRSGVTLDYIAHNIGNGLFWGGLVVAPVLVGLSWLNQFLVTRQNEAWRFEWAITSEFRDQLASGSPGPLGCESEVKATK